MHLFQPDRSRSLALLIRIFTVLGLLLIVLVAINLLSDFLGFLDRFRTEVYLFVLGALLAYLMAPVVRVLKRLVRKQWAAVLSAYLLLLTLLVILGALLLTPFVSQAQALVKNMQNPSGTSVQRLRTVRSQLTGIQSTLNNQQSLLAAGRPILQQQVQQTQAAINTVVQETARLTDTTKLNGAAPIPPSYVRPLTAAVQQLAAAYAVGTPTIDQSHLTKDVALAINATNQAADAYQKMTSTPLLLLDLQLFLDQHGINLDLHDRFSQALKALNSQVTSLLNNALGISLQAGNMLLDLVLICIISIYLLRDGARLVRWLVAQSPPEVRPRVSRAVQSLDQILGSYLRTQIVLALMAGLTDAIGAAVLHVPYAVIIFFSSFLLSLVPVIGPVVLPIPPLTIALLFTPLPKPLIYLLWLLIGEQAVTNVVGPRLQAHNLRIHPLEAMAAALAGLPLAGLAGAFFAVPVVAFVHIVIREFAHARDQDDSMPGGGRRDQPLTEPAPQARDVRAQA